VELSPASLSIAVGGSSKLVVTVKDAASVVIPNAQVAWAAAPDGIVSVVSDGTVGGVAAGSATVTASINGKSAQAAVTVSSGTVLPPPPSGEGAAFIIGPQVPLGQSPWAFFDANQRDRALDHYNTVMSTTGNEYVLANYYDTPLAFYGLYARSEDQSHLRMARDAADKWYLLPEVQACTNDMISPRHSGLSGLMMRALDGRPDMWPCITQLAQSHYTVWLGLRLTNSELHYGVRDGAFALLHVAQLSVVHPDSGVRHHMREQALKAARDYYARLQHSNGGWYWYIGEAGGQASQPFMIGLLLEALIATHQVTSDDRIARSIVSAVDWLQTYAYERQAVTNLSGVYWRAMKYLVTLTNPSANDRTDATRWGSPDGAIRDERQLNATTVHAYGYAFRITGDSKYTQWGDEVFASTFGRGQGPLADKYYGLADFRAKEYNQSYRAGVRYLAWRSVR
jgi:hypothetical protein